MTYPEFLGAVAVARRPETAPGSLFAYTDEDHLAASKALAAYPAAFAKPEGLAVALYYAATGRRVTLLPYESYAGFSVRPDCGGLSSELLRTGDPLKIVEAITKAINDQPTGWATLEP